MRFDAMRCWIAAGVLAVSAVASAGERTIATCDWTGRGSAPEVVGYDVPAVDAEKLRVTGPDGKPADFSANMPDAKHHVILRLAGKPGEEYHWILFPRAKNEPAPRVERPASGVVKVTHAEGTDWIVSAPDRIQWSGGDVACGHNEKGQAHTATTTAAW